MSGSGECRLEGLCIKASPLGENDRLITILTDEQGIIRLAVPGARRPKSSLAAATPLTYLSLQIFGKRNLKSVRQIKILKSYSGLGKNIECLAAAQAITELTFLLVGNNDKQQDYLSCVLAHLDRIYLYEKMGIFLKNNFSGWEFWLLSGNPKLTKYLKMKSSLKIPVSNGGIDCRWIKYLIR